MTFDEHLGRLQFFHAKLGKMAYVDQGQGETILLLHGVPTSSWLNRKIIPGLVDHGYRVVAPDMIGYGASAKPKTYDTYTDRNMGSLLLDLMKHLDIPEWHQVFHDGGGLWTWAMLKEDRSKVKSLFMLNTIVYQEGFKPPMKFEKGWWARIYTKLYTYSIIRRFIVKATMNNGIKDGSVINKEMLNGYYNAFANGGETGIYYFFTQTCQKIEDYSSLHQSLNLPLTVIWGRHDDILVWKYNAPIVKRNFGITDNDIFLLDGKHFIQLGFIFLHLHEERRVQIVLLFVNLTLAWL